MRCVIIWWIMCTVYVVYNVHSLTLSFIKRSIFLPSSIQLSATNNFFFFACLVCESRLVLIVPALLRTELQRFRKAMKNSDYPPGRKMLSLQRATFKVFLRLQYFSLCPY